MGIPNPIKVIGNLVKAVPDELKKSLPNIVQTLSLAPPFNTLGLGAIAPILQAVLPGNDKITADNALQKINQAATIDPSILLQLKTADADLAVKLASLGLEYYKADTAAVADARNMQIQTRGWMPAALAVAIVAIFFYLVWAVVHGQLSQGGEIAVMIVGQVLGFVGALVTFNYGTSAGSSYHAATAAQQAQLMANMVPISSVQQLTDATKSAASPSIDDIKNLVLELLKKQAVDAPAPTN